MPDSLHYKMFINGIWQDASDAKRFDSINPATEKPWCSVPESTEEDINRAVESAHAAFTSGPWGFSSFFSSLLSVVSRSSQFMR